MRREHYPPPGTLLESPPTEPRHIVLRVIDGHNVEVISDSTGRLEPGHRGSADVKGGHWLICNNEDDRKKHGVVEVIGNAYTGKSR